MTSANFCQTSLRKLTKTLNVAASVKDVNAVHNAINTYGLKQVLIALRFVSTANVPYIASVISYYLGDVSRPIGAEVSP